MIMSIHKKYLTREQKPSEGLFQLFFALKSLKYKDQSPMRRSIYNQLIGEFPLYKRLVDFYQVLPASIKPITVYIYSALTLAKIPNLNKTSSAPIICVWENLPEYNTISSLGEKARSIMIRNSYKNLVRNLFRLDLSLTLRLYSVVKMLTKKEDLLVSLRLTQLLFFYSFFDKANLDERNVIFLSSDASPWALGLISLKKKNVSIRYTPHGILPLSKNKIPYTVTTFITKYNHDRFKSNCLGGTKAMYQVKEQAITFKKLKPSDVKVGIIESIVPNQVNLLLLFDRLTSQGYKVKIKKHPNRIINSNHDKIVDQSRYCDNLEHSDIIISGNSGHAIKMLARGKITLFCDDIDNAPNDIYGLNKMKILLPIEYLDDLDAVIQYYNSEEWRELWRNI
jgi:hypothetical protein